MNIQVKTENWLSAEYLSMESVWTSAILFIMRYSWMYYEINIFPSEIIAFVKICTLHKNYNCEADSIVY
jgi:hypothetical protein